MQKIKVGKILLGFLARTVMWAAVLGLAALAAPSLGLTLGSGVPGAFVMGALGLPGFALLLIVQTIFL